MFWNFFIEMMNRAMNATQTRTFHIVDYPQEGDVWNAVQAKTPMEAAHYAFRALATELGFVQTDDGQRYLVFTIGEDGKKPRTYIGTWVELYQPIPLDGTNGEYVKRRPVVTNWIPELEQTFFPESNNKNKNKNKNKK